jgi:hypothetical protein
MKTKKLLALATGVVTDVLFGSMLAEAQVPARKPNIVVIMADNIGCGISAPTIAA